MTLLKFMLLFSVEIVNKSHVFSRTSKSDFTHNRWTAYFVVFCCSCCSPVKLALLPFLFFVCLWFPFFNHNAPLQHLWIEIRLCTVCLDYFFLLFAFSCLIFHGLFDQLLTLFDSQIFYFSLWMKQPLSQNIERLSPLSLGSSAAAGQQSGGLLIINSILPPINFLLSPP